MGGEKRKPGCYLAKLVEGETHEVEHIPVSMDRVLTVIFVDKSGSEFCIEVDAHEGIAVRTIDGRLVVKPEMANQVRLVEELRK